MLLEECPVRAALDVIGGKWKPIVLFHLMEGKKRFGELQKLIPEATQKVLTQQLRELEGDGVILRRIHPTVPPKVEYSFTPAGRTLRPALKALCQWSRSFSALSNAGAGNNDVAGRKRGRAGRPVKTSKKERLFTRVQNSENNGSSVGAWPV